MDRTTEPETPTTSRADERADRLIGEWLSPDDTLRDMTAPDETVLLALEAEWLAEDA